MNILFDYVWVMNEITPALNFKKLGNEAVL